MNTKEEIKTEKGNKNTHTHTHTQAKANMSTQTKKEILKQK